MNQTTLARAFLLFTSAGLIPVALGYGVMPAATMEALYGITIEGPGLNNIMRATMCLYLGMASLWLVGAFRPAATQTALLVCGIFMSSIAVGRVLSLALDGMPHWLLVAFTGLEVAGGAAAFALYRAGGHQ